MNFIYEVIGYPLGWIMWLCYKIIPFYGIALLLFTILSKLIQVPLAIKQQKSTIRQAQIQPKMTALQDKYKDNKEKLNEEMSKFMQEEKYNPMSGCLPLLIQFPILFWLIDVVYKPLTHILRFSKETIAAATEIVNNIVATGAISESATIGYRAQLTIIAAVKNPEFQSEFSALGAEFIDAVSNLRMTFLGINLGDTPSWAFPIILIPLLSGATALLSSIITQKTQGSANSGQQSGMMKGMTYILPLISLFFTMTVPAGVGLYWTYSNVLAMVQSWILNKKYNVKETLAEIQRQQEAEKEEKKQLKAEAKKKRLEGQTLDPELQKKALSDKELNRIKLAEARKRDAEKYGEEYVEVTDEDLI